MYISMERYDYVDIYSEDQALNVPYLSCLSEK